MVYSLGVVIIKLSVLLFYRRLFGHNNPTLQAIVRYFILFQIIFAIASIFAFALVCHPIRAWWTVPLRANSCPTFHQMAMISVSLRVVTATCDIAVLLLPMPLVRRLPFPAKKRFGLAVVFFLGFVACVIAIVRLALLPKLTMSLDVSCNGPHPPHPPHLRYPKLTCKKGNIVPIALLDQAEQCVGIITASIPALTALISRYCVSPSPKMSSG